MVDGTMPEGGAKVVAVHIESLQGLACYGWIGLDGTGFANSYPLILRRGDESLGEGWARGRRTDVEKARGCGWGLAFQVPLDPRILDSLDQPLDLEVKGAGVIQVVLTLSPFALSHMKAARELDYWSPVIATPAKQGIPRNAEDIAGQTILYVVHDAEGGAVATSQDLALMVAGSARVFMLRCGRTQWRLEKVITDHDDGGVAGPCLKTVETIGFEQPWAQHVLPDEARVAALQRIVHDLRPDVAHVRSVIYFSPELLVHLRPFVRRLIFSAHDFVAICLNGFLFNGDNKFCGGDCGSGTKRCLPADLDDSAPPLRGKSVYPWRARCIAALDHVDAIVVTSQTTIDVFLPYVSAEVLAKFHIIEHGRAVADWPDKAAAKPSAPLLPGTPFRIVLVGAINEAKGAVLVQELAKAVAGGDLDAEIHVVGYMSVLINQSRSVVYGPYSRGRLSPILDQIAPTVGLVPVQWPETYSHVVTELAMSNIPMIASNFGAVGERVRLHNLGWVLPQVTAESIIELLKRLKASPKELEERRQAVRRYRCRTEEGMAEDYIGLYNGVMN
ncbi:glycosyltransferase [Nitrospirillum amazonense]|uniref:glycosyltransferase n=1 Tax=Nitrospirillum amazonense TaxID=28077 RepID=UPI002DD44EFD|nr:glycosyltransferase [Nitrospirillum amazonense]MEC4594319.1 glycosyltransferase [Nitrospirillum amazonense]